MCCVVFHLWQILSLPVHLMVHDPRYIFGNIVDIHRIEQVVQSCCIDHWFLHWLDGVAVSKGEWEGKHINLFSDEVNIMRGKTHQFIFRRSKYQIIILSNATTSCWYTNTTNSALFNMKLSASHTKISSHLHQIVYLLWGNSVCKRMCKCYMGLFFYDVR